MIYLIPTIFFTLLLSGCGSTIDLTSSWKEREIIIDGNRSDWSGKTTYYEKHDISLGFRNDQDFLYLCVFTSNRSTQMQILSGGMTVWLDPEGNENKQFGFRFPIGGQRNMMPPPSRSNDLAGIPNRREMLEQLQNECEIIYPGTKERERIAFKDGGEFAAKIGIEGGTLVYELKLPIKKNKYFPFDFNEMAGQIIGIGFETTLNQQAGRPSPQFNTTTGRAGIRSIAGRSRSSSGSEEARNPSENPQPLKFWTKVSLASKGSDS